MKTIWAPWRIEYIRGPKDEGCFLCDMFKLNDDRQRLLLKRGDLCAVVINRYPYTPGHLMVAPYRHVDTLSAMTDEERSEMMRLTCRAVEVLTARVHPHGFNIGMNLGEQAGAGLKDHVHMHIVPRWTGDTNFMPVLGHVKVLPQSLDDLWDMLHDGFT
jgi:ATP adenylyltransferase